MTLEVAVYMLGVAQEASMHRSQFGVIYIVQLAPHHLFAELKQPTLTLPTYIILHTGLGTYAAVYV
jgi:hypothetical protein